MEIKTINDSEKMYTYSQSQQISMQTGLIGYLRADMGTDGNKFFSTWNEYSEKLKTQGFSNEFNEVINSLREDFLKDRAALAKYCNERPESSYGKDSLGNVREYGVRVNTDNYAYLLRLNPHKGEYNLYCYCYIKDRLDNHLHQAEKGIRFITPRYKEIFRIPDGDMIRITTPSGEKLDRTCRYIDEYHVEVGRNLYHICQFAEMLEGNNSKVIPLRSSLPDLCYANLPSTGELIIITKGESGYKNASSPYDSPERNKELAEGHNAEMGITKAQAAAMLAGSMFGWEVPAADPTNYDDNGTPVKIRQRDRGDAR